jgi:hypothetical protein
MDVVRIAEQLDSGRLTPDELGAQYSLFLEAYKQVTGGNYQRAIRLEPNDPSNKRTDGTPT